MDNNNIDFYLQYSKSTNPGEFEYLYKDLPDSLDELCELINCQLVHPHNKKIINRYRKLRNRRGEQRKFYNIELCLKQLIRRNPAGLTLNRQPEERLLHACGFFARFLASIMKYKKTPARIRRGFAQYLAPRSGKSMDHAICEIWNNKEKRWMLVDPDKQKVDFDRSKFNFANDLW